MHDPGHQLPDRIRFHQSPHHVRLRSSFDALDFGRCISPMELHKSRCFPDPLGANKSFEQVILGRPGQIQLLENDDL